MRSLGLAVLVGGAIAGASATFPLGDTDLWWHLANARETLQHGLVRADVFSWTAAGAPVATDQWLGDLLLYAGYAIGGWIGVTVVRTLAVAVLVGAIAFAAIVRRPLSPAAALVIALPAILLSRYVWIERPELFGAVCLAVLVALLQLQGERPLFACGGLLLVWAQLHGSFALGAALVILVAVHGLAFDRALRRGYALAGFAALLSFVLTPAGIGTLAAPAAHLLSPPREIQEWAPPDLATAPGALWATVLFLTLATASLAGGARPRDVALIAPLAALSLVAIRHAPLFAIAATPYVADRLPAAVEALTRNASRSAEGPRERGGPPERRTPQSGQHKTELGAVARVVAQRELRGFRRSGERSAQAVSVGVGALMIVAGIAIAPREPIEDAYPVAALASLPSGPGLLAEYDWGGWLIWRAPATPVFIDGRLGPYRGAILEDYVAIVEAHPGWRDALARRGVRSLLVRPSDPVAVRALDLGWPVVARSPYFVLISVADRSQ
jgi:hypothetical protein